jgi:hypothetical protein
MEFWVLSKDARASHRASGAICVPPRHHRQSYFWIFGFALIFDFDITHDLESLDSQRYDCCESLLVIISASYSKTKLILLIQCVKGLFKLLKLFMNNS